MSNSSQIGGCLALGLALSTLCGGAQAACGLARIAELPVTMSGLRPLVPAKINGDDVMFEADSGAFYSMLSPAAAAEHKLYSEVLPGMTVTGIGGDTQASFVTVKTFTLANVPIHNVEFLVLGGGEGDAAGLLGQNVLGLADVEYDFAHGAIRLWEAKDCYSAVLAYWAKDQAYSTVGINRSDEHNPHTEGAASIDGKSIQVTFDTGASYSMLTLKAAKRLGLDVNAPTASFGGMASGIGRSEVKSWIVPVASLKIGDEEIRNTKLRVADTEVGESDMLLGADFFLSHRVYVSNGQHKLYFTYNGGPVFNLTAGAMVTSGSDQAATASPIAALGPDPTDAEGFSRRGAAFAARQDFDRAIADFTRACELAPTESKYFYQRALARLNDKQPVLARADLDQSLKLKPDDVSGLILRARLRLFDKDKTGARADLDAAAAVAPKQADSRLELGNLYSALDQFDIAIAQYDPWIGIHGDDPQLPEALNDRCWARALSGQNLDWAMNDCNRALRLRPQTAAFLDSRGMVELRQGKYDRAVSDYDLALALNPRIVWSLYGRGLAELNLGQATQGRADVAAAIKLDPKLPQRATGYGIAGPPDPAPVAVIPPPVAAPGK